MEQEGFNMKKPRVLIVEDEAIVAEDLEITITDIGYDVVGRAVSAEEAMKKAYELRPDLILMDIVLRGDKNGIDASHDIKEMGIPIIFLTAYSDIELIDRAKSIEPYAYIVKPFQERQLLASLEVALYKSRMEKKLKESEEWLSTTLRSIGDAVIATDPSGYVKFINPVAEALTGWRREEAMGTPLTTVFSVISEKTGKSTGGPVAEVLRLGVTVGVSNDTILIARDGTRVPIDDSGAPIRDDKGEIIGAVLVFRDIAERKKAEEEKKSLEGRLRQAQKMEAIGTLAGGIAHDFNNILSAIIGYTELAQFDVAQASAVRSSLDEVLKASRRATDLVKQILTFSRQGEHEKKPLEMGALVKETLKFLRASVPVTIQIRQNIKGETGTVLADATQIHQVLMNLCTNAAQAMGEKGGVLEVSLGNLNLDADGADQYPNLEPGQYVRLTVSDTGHGMDREVMERIFEPFFTTKKQDMGTGMGLSVVHGIVKSHGGVIAVHSEPGRGTTFHVLFPTIERAAAPEHLQIGPVPGGKGRILFVDDEEQLVRIGQQALERLGYDVTTRTSSVEALEAFCAKPDRFDLVITDQTMPNMTGVELGKEFMRIRSDIPVILCTGFSEAISKKRVREIGIRELLMKPVVIRDLAETVQRVLDKEME
jgi:two-component system cell cycle sensor histidine kinase/response regulator CckA